MGGDVSTRKPRNIRPTILLGQDESVFKQYSFSSKTWTGPTGENTLLPKSDGYSKMVSAYMSRPMGMGVIVSSSQLESINKSRKRKKYISVDSANTINGTTEKNHL